MTVRTPALGPECPDCGSEAYIFVAYKGRGMVRLECEHCRATYLVPDDTLPPGEFVRSY